MLLGKLTIQFDFQNHGGHKILHLENPTRNRNTDKKKTRMNSLSKTSVKRLARWKYSSATIDSRKRPVHYFNGLIVRVCHLPMMYCKSERFLVWEYWLVHSQICKLHNVTTIPAFGRLIIVCGWLVRRVIKKGIITLLSCFVGVLMVPVHSFYIKNPHERVRCKKNRQRVFLVIFLAVVYYSTTFLVLAFFIQQLFHLLLAKNFDCWARPLCLVKHKQLFYNFEGFLKRLFKIKLN